jgi:hypothetical protein
MPTRWTGSVEDRLARLDHAHRRCDGNNRRCVHSANEVYQLLPAKNGQPLPDAKPITKQACSRHRPQFLDSQNYCQVGETERLPERPASKPGRYQVPRQVKVE